MKTAKLCLTIPPPLNAAMKGKLLKPYFMDTKSSFHFSNQWCIKSGCENLNIVSIADFVEAPPQEKS